MIGVSFITSETLFVFRFLNCHSQKVIASLGINKNKVKYSLLRMRIFWGQECVKKSFVVSEKDFLCCPKDPGMS